MTRLGQHSRTTQPSSAPTPVAALPLQGGAGWRQGRSQRHAPEALHAVGVQPRSPSPLTRTARRLAQLALALAVLALGQLAAAQTVQVPDPNLRTAILKQLLDKQPGSAITEADMASLQTLSADYHGIRNLSGLEFAVNLTTLHLEGNLISDLSPLAGLTRLRTLILGDNRVQDISPLAGLAALRWLDLSGNRVLDLSPLAGLDGLTHLHLHGNCPPPARNNCLADIAPLAGLAELELLSLANNDIEDVSALDGLTELSWLALANNRIKDISPLLDNPGLDAGDYLSLLGNPYDAADAAPLVASGITLAAPGEQPPSPPAPPQSAQRPSSPLALPPLTPPPALMQWLDLQLELVPPPPLALLQTADDPVTILDANLRTAIVGALNLQREASNILIAASNDAAVAQREASNTLIAASNAALVASNAEREAEGLAPIEPTALIGPIAPTALIELLAPSDTVTEGHLAGLFALYAFGADISDLTGLEFATGLMTLRLVNSRISDLTPLIGLSSLRRLLLDSNNITTLPNLAALTNLRVLSLDSNNITTLPNLAALTNLRVLSLDSNNITDGMLLGGLTRLKFLSLNNNNLGSLQWLSGLTDLAGLELDNSLAPTVTNLGGLASNQLTHLVLSNNQLTTGSGVLTGLSSLPNLETLDLSHNRIIGIDPLVSLTALTDLRLNDNLISSIPVVSGLDSLETLDLSFNAITNINPLLSLTALTMLNLLANPLDSTSIDTAIPSLRAGGVTVLFIPPGLRICTSDPDTSSDPNCPIHRLVTIIETSNVGRADRLPVTVLEGSNAEFTLTRTTTGPLDVTVVVSETGGMVADGHKGVTAVPFPDGQTTTMMIVPTEDDRINENSSRLTVELVLDADDPRLYSRGSAAESYASVTVTDDDAPEVTISAHAERANVSEGTSVVFVLTRQSPLGRTSEVPTTETLEVTVDVSETEDMLAAGTSQVTVMFTHFSPTASLILRTVNDDENEADSTVTVTLTDTAAYTPVVPMTATATITDNDDYNPGPLATIEPVTDSVVEGSPAEFTLTLASAATEALAVGVFVYAPEAMVTPDNQGETSVMFQIGDSTATLTVRTIADSENELDGAVLVQLLPAPTPTGGADTTLYSLGDGTKAFASVTVTDDD